MFVSSDVIAKKYASAFLNVYFSQIDDTFLKRISLLKDFFKKHRYAYVYFRISNILKHVKMQALTKIAHAFKLDKSVVRLMILLLEQDRIEILDRVLSFIILSFQERKGIEVFTVMSSHPLTKEEKLKVIKFIEFNTPKKVNAEFLVDEKLLVGLRIKSHSFLWERSIEKQLRDIRQFMLK